jgi:hypothetical protein
MVKGKWVAMTVMSRILKALYTSITMFYSGRLEIASSIREVLEIYARHFSLVAGWIIW